MNTLPIIAGSQVELDAFLLANRWLNPAFITRVTEPEHLQWRGGLVLALPGWEVAPAIGHPRKLLEVIAQRDMHLVVLQHAEFHLVGGLDLARDRFEVTLPAIDPDKEKAAQHHKERLGLCAPAGTGGEL